MKAFYCLWLCMLVSQAGLAQSDSVQRVASNIVRRMHASYDEEIMYYGKHNRYFTVRVFRKNGVLLRLDSYTLLPEILANGFRLDSTSRIIHHGPTKIMYPSGQQYVRCEYVDNELNGPFMVFYEDGSMKRREYYRSGRITRKSQCFTADGNEQQCEPFYQNAQFQGNHKDLQTYLTQKLGSVLDGDQVRRVTAALTINEIGQVIRINVAVLTSPYAEGRVPIVGNYVQQIIRNMPEWTPDQLNWKPAVNDGVSISSTCILSVFRFYGEIQYSLSYRM